MQQMLVQSLGWEDPLEKEMVSLPGESHKQRSRAEKETNMTWCLNNNINKVYNSVALSILILPCNHSHIHLQNFFIFPNGNSIPQKNMSPFFPSSVPGIYHPLPVSINVTILGPHQVQLRQYLSYVPGLFH